MMVSRDTIAALATPVGTSGVAIVRISGNEAIQICSDIVHVHSYPDLHSVEPRYLVYVDVLSDESVIDRGLAVVFRSPQSFTGEDVVELHLHGNMVIAETVLGLLMHAGARLATPGEFSMRAFLHGKMDLLQVEALAEVLAVEDAQDLKAAQRQLGGELRLRFEDLRTQLVSVLARLELELDFVEEGYSFATVDEITELLQGLRHSVISLLNRTSVGGSRRQGPVVVFAGAPNAGKSSLFNALLGYSRSIISPVAGTTRDYVEERVYYNGRAWTLIDTAGLRFSHDEIESTGIERTNSLVKSADLVVYLVESAIGKERGIADFYEFTQGIDNASALLCWSKIDLTDAGFCEPGHGVSSVTGAGLSELWERLSSSLERETGSEFLLSLRQIDLLRSVQSIIDDAIEASCESTEILASELRRLNSPLAMLVGDVVADDVLNHVFSSFCIGK